MQSLIALIEKLLVRYEPQLIDFAAVHGKSIALKIWRRYVAMALAGTLPARLRGLGPAILLIDEEFDFKPDLNPFADIQEKA